MPATTDRRVRRTRTLLVQALVSLILERGYARITVQDILDRADVGRSTFYAHFRDKEALLLSCFDGLREDLRRDLAGDGPGQGQPGPARAGSVVFAHAHQHRDVYRALCGRQGGTIVSGHLHDVLSDSISADLASRPAGPRSAIPAEIRAEHAVSALLGLLTWWVSQDFRYGRAEMACMYGLLATAALTA